MPIPLVVVLGLAGICAGVGVLLTCALGRTDLARVPLWASLPVVVLPFTIALYLGFTENRTWTRPLIVLLLVLASLTALVSELPLVALLLGASCLATGIYLYASPSCRAYYDVLRHNQLTHIEPRDLASQVMVPLYAGAAGLILGASVAYAIVVGEFRSAAGLGANDATGLVAAMVLVGGLFAVLGRLIAEVLLARRRRAA